MRILSCLTCCVVVSIGSWAAAQGLPIGNGGFETEINPIGVWDPNNWNRWPQDDHFVHSIEAADPANGASNLLVVVDTEDEFTIPTDYYLYSVQRTNRFRQYSINHSVDLVPDKLYRLRFWARADGPRTLMAGYFSNGKYYAYQALLYTEEVEISTDWDEYTVDFFHHWPEAMDGNDKANFFISFGLQSGDYEFDDVRIEMLDITQQNVLDGQSPGCRRRAKFEPPAGKKLLFIGQDLPSIGGLDEFDDGYVDHFEQLPYGVVSYFAFNDGVLEAYDDGLGLLGLDADLRDLAPYVDPYTAAQLLPLHTQRYIDDSTFARTAIAIGLQFHTSAEILPDQLDEYGNPTFVITRNYAKSIHEGQFDDLIDEFAVWAKDNWHRRIFLRIGYEFDYPDNNYLPVADDFKRAYRHIWRRLKRQRVRNVAFVWQSWGDHIHSATRHMLNLMYPGDRYVDWMGYSHFHVVGPHLIKFARARKKPVLIAEATPIAAVTNCITELNPDGSCPSYYEVLRYGLDVTKGEDVPAIEHWLHSFFAHIEANSDIIKGVSFINSPWKEFLFWQLRGWFAVADSRLQVNPDIRQLWLDNVSRENGYVFAPTCRRHGRR